MILMNLVILVDLVILMDLVDLVNFTSWTIKIQVFVAKSKKIRLFSILKHDMGFQNHA